MNARRVHLETIVSLPDTLFVRLSNDCACDDHLQRNSGARAVVHSANASLPDHDAAVQPLVREHREAASDPASALEDGIPPR
jgi:hypothetical protein